MKKIVFLVCFLVAFGIVNAQVKVDHTGGQLKISYANLVRLTNAKGFVGTVATGEVADSVTGGVVILKLNSPGRIAPEQFAGVFFDEIPQLKHALTIWRYKPGGVWSKPVAVTKATTMADGDVQFFYWQYKDGLYGAAVPLSGMGFRTTLGSAGSRWGSKAISYAENKNVSTVPAMAIAFGKDPFQLFRQIYSVSLKAMGHSNDRILEKKMPEPLQYIGWCTWNSSNLGRDLNEEHLLAGVKTFADHKYQLGWVLIDDGWFQQQDGQLQSNMPDRQKFPNGFKPVVDKLKNTYGIKYVGIWHAFDGYWNGIDPASPLGHQFDGKLFSWNGKEDNGSVGKKYYFVKPENDNMYDFYSSLHQYLKNEGFDFIKVDNQVVTEKLAPDNYPINDLSASMHRALNRSVDRYFNGAMINCMDMTPDAYTNFGSSAVARAVEDYFPYEKGETYNLQHGNAAAHVVQAVYNALYFSQMVYPDFDMFQSHNPNAVFHALARTLNNGPIYLTDIPGKQNFEILNKIAFADGRSVRSQTALLPAEDCLFQVQGKQLFKAWSKVGNTGLLVLYNAADAESVSGNFKASDVHGLAGTQFALYEYFSGKVRIATRNTAYESTLPRLGYQLEYVVPVRNGFAPFGLVNKYNAPATISGQKWNGKKALVTLYEGGRFRAYAADRPINLLINGAPGRFTYKDHLITAEIPAELRDPIVEIDWR